MVVQLFFLLFIIAVLIVIAGKSIAITKEDERLVVFRLGKFFRVCPPGRSILIPYVDRAVKVRVDQIAGWRTLPESELQRQLAQAVIDNSSKES